MKICLIGYGYWGKILYKNLINMGIDDITIIDESLNNTNLLTEEFSHYIIATPFSTHKYFLEKIGNFENKKIWCEKPLVETYDDSIRIYNLMETNNNKLFVDWVYTHNPCVVRLKEILDGKKLKQIILNRTNLGPIRTDCSSIHDLSSHDLSILYFLFENDEFNFNFNEFSIENGKNIGSNISWSYDGHIQIIINSSWEHHTKNRVSFFVTNDDKIIVFDDLNKVLINNGDVENFSNDLSPIEKSINKFISSDDFEKNKIITLKIVKNIENIYEHKI